MPNADKFLLKEVKPGTMRYKRMVHALKRPIQNAFAPEPQYDYEATNRSGLTTFDRPVLIRGEWPK